MQQVTHTHSDWLPTGDLTVTPTNDQGTGCRGSQGVHSKAGAGIPCCTLGGQPPYGGLSHFGVIEGGLA